MKRLGCQICHHNCLLADGQTGICGVRKRVGDQISSLVYGRVIAENIDPIEKKPIFHMQPGSLTYSIATPGCNFRCKHCQNASISQVRGGEIFTNIVERSPETLVSDAAANGCRSMSYTYVEPTVFFEFALDCCRLAAEKNIKNVFVSNGYMSESSLAQLGPMLSAVNVDLKAYSEEFYKDICGAKLAPVLENIRVLHSLGVWIEVTTLIIPGLNDSDRELTQIAEFLAGIDRNIPWHVSGFYPTYQLTSVKPTPLSTLAQARRIGLESGLSFVYTGNSPGSGGECTTCPSCSAELIVRHGFRVVENRLLAGSCPVCDIIIPGVWA